MRDPERAEPRVHQTTFLVLDDYGTGGIWFYLHARSALEINEVFPELTVISSWLEWMTPGRVIPLVWNLHAYDIEAPTGWLAMYAKRRR